MIFFFSPNSRRVFPPSRGRLFARVYIQTIRFSRSYTRRRSPSEFTSRVSNLKRNKLSLSLSLARVLGVKKKRREKIEVEFLWALEREYIFEGARY